MSYKKCNKPKISLTKKIIIESVENVSSRVGIIPFCTIYEVKFIKTNNHKGLLNSQQHPLSTGMFSCFYMKHS